MRDIISSLPKLCLSTKRGQPCADGTRAFADIFGDGELQGYLRRVRRFGARQDNKHSKQSLRKRRMAQPLGQ